MRTLMEIMTKVIAAPANVKNHKQNLLVHSLRALAGVLLLFYLVIALVIVALRWVDPPTSAVQIERRVEAWSNHTPYQSSTGSYPAAHLAAASARGGGGRRCPLL